MKHDTGITPKPLTLTEIASRIRAHLKRFEVDPKLNPNSQPDGMSTSQYYHAHAYQASAYVCIVYVSYQGANSLKRADAEKYLAWLDAGNSGTHWKALREMVTKEVSA